MKILFHLNTYNDVDHITPIIWRFLERGDLVTTIFLSNFDYDNDYRIQFLSRFENFSIYNRDVLFGESKLKLLHLRRKLFFNSRFSRFYESKIGGLFVYVIHKYLWPNRIVKECAFTIYEMGGPGRLNHADAQFYGVPVICLPHGQNIFLNYDVTKSIHNYRKQKGKWPDFSNRSKFDLYVLQTERHRRWSIEWGQDPVKTVAWGSARFYPEWARINLSLCDSFSSINQSKDKLRIVFFLPHWEYNVNVEHTLSLIFSLAKLSNVYLVIKGHTRGSGSLDDKWETKLNKYSNVEANVAAHSPTLIAWSDLVINFGSSIAIEAIIQNKPLIHTLYLHTNQTVFDDGLVSYVANNKKEVLSYISMLQDGDLHTPPDTEKLKFFQSEIFAGNSPHDVLELYYKKLCEISN